MPSTTGSAPLRHTRLTPKGLVLALTLLSGGTLLPTPGAHSADLPKPAAKTTSDRVPGDTNGGLGWNAVSTSINQQLDDISTSLQNIFSTLNQSDSHFADSQLDSLIARAQRIQQSNQTVLTQIQSYDQITTSYLNILGPKVEDSEDKSVTTQRAALQRNSQAVKAALMRSRLYDLQAQQLITAISTRQTQLQQAALSQKTISPISPRFWKNLVSENPLNTNTLQRGGTLSNWLMLLTGTLATLLITGFLAPLSRRAFKRLGNRLHISTEDTERGIVAGYALARTLSGLACSLLGLILWQIWTSFLPDIGTGSATIPGADGPIARTLTETLPVCCFLLGAALPSFTPRHVSQPKDGTPAKPTTRSAEWVLTLSVLLMNILHVIRIQNTFGSTLQNLLEILFVLFLGLTVTTRLKRIGRTSPTRKFIPTALGLSSLVLTVSVIAILMGYVAFAFSLNTWLLTLGTGISIIVLLGLCWRSLLTHIFDSESPISARLSTFGLSSTRLTQIGVLLSGAGNILLLLLLFAIAQTDKGLSLSDIAGRLQMMFIGNTIHGVTISLDTVFLCLIVIAIAYYLIRQTRIWIRDRFLPTTQLDIGARTSILSIFTYCAWIIVGLTVLSIAGLSVQNLTWVVSALSVGIGFGLQSIVQNFVSGMILMAERPVRVGDMVEIGGTKGDVRRISIRATDIGMSDGSTVIVPNSQFITGSVKNLTTSGSTSALTLSFNVPSTTDLERVKSMLIEVAAQNPNILANPAPSVRVNALSSFSVTMALSMRIMSARDSSSIQDAILFSIFRRFSKENITLTTA